MDEFEKIRVYKDRIRIFLILYFFSEDYFDENNPHLKKVFYTETKIQKIDFFLRSPDYLALELLNFAEKGLRDKNEIKAIVEKIFQDDEPVLKRLDMEKFFFGAYEDIDDVIGFLKAYGFIEFSSTKSTDLKTVDKKYFVTEYAINKVKNTLPALPTLQWYVERCRLIKNFLGDKTGADLKKMQYEVEEYKETSWRGYIKSIQDEVRRKYFDLYGETL